MPAQASRPADRPTSEHDRSDRRELADEVDVDVVEPTWREVWQLPAAVAGVVLLILGMILLARSRPEVEFERILTEVSTLTEAGDFDRAFQLLSEVEPHKRNMGTRERTRYRLVRADLFYKMQVTRGGNLEHNLAEVVGDYRFAEQLGAELSSNRIFRMADSLIRLGRLSDVMPVINRFGEEDRSRRHELMKTLVDRHLGLATSTVDDTAAVLAKFLSERDLSAEDTIWGIARLAELRLENGFVEEAIDRLLIAMQQLNAQGIHHYPELFLLLGRAYFESGRLDHAREQLEHADRAFEPDNPGRGEAIYLLGRVAQQRRLWDEAFVAFNTVVGEFSATRAHVPALLGRAEVHAQEGRHQPALADYGSVVATLVQHGGSDDDRRGLNRNTVTRSIIAWHDRSRQQDDLEMALRYARAAERLYPGRVPMPDDLLIRLARTCAELGTRLLHSAWVGAGVALGPDGTPIIDADAARVDPGTRNEAQRLLLDSGEYYRRRAEAFIQFEPDVSAESLRRAAEAFDRGGGYESAIESLREFVRLSVNHPRSLWGIYMLGRSYQALGDYDGAIAEFTRLIREHGRSNEAYRSYVPLAQCYMEHPTKPNPVEAERLLLHVVNGHAELDPDAWEFREALIELGTLYARAAEYPMPRPAAEFYPEAIRRLTEAIERYPDDPRVPDLHYRLGHAYRLSAEALKTDLEIERPEVERLALVEQRQQHLDSAMVQYGEAIDAWERIPPDRRTVPARQTLQYAKFWRADCALDRGSYAQAIRLYAEVADEYPEDSASVVALVQIVNAYAAIGDFDAARTAQGRAWRLLRDLHPTLDEAGPLPMTRDAWERLLRAGRMIEEGELSAAGASP